MNPQNEIAFLKEQLRVNSAEEARRTAGHERERDTLRQELHVLRQAMEEMRVGHLQELGRVQVAFRAQLAQELQHQQANHAALLQAALGGAASAGGSRAASGGGASGMSSCRKASHHPSQLSWT